MTRRVFYHADALAELEALARQFYGYSTLVGDRFIDTVETVLNRCARFPDSSPLFYRTLRKASLSHYAVILLYAVADDAITVAAMVEARRNPDALRSLFDSRLEP